MAFRDIKRGMQNLEGALGRRPLLGAFLFPGDFRLLAHLPHSILMWLCAANLPLRLLRVLWRRSRRGSTLWGDIASSIAVVFLAFLALTWSIGSTMAVFSETQPVPSNTLSTKADWESPTTSSAKILNSAGNADYLRQGGTYNVCANISDGGNPPSGISTATTNVAVTGNVVTTGQTAAALTSGSYTCDGASYNYQSASLTADGTISEGSKTFQVTGTDVAGNPSATTSWSVIIDNTSPSTTAFATTNNGATAGKMEAGDVFTVTMSENTIDLNRIISGWNGSSTSVAAEAFNNDSNFGGNDGLVLCTSLTANCVAAGNGTMNILGTINLGATSYVTTGVVEFSATIAWNSGTSTFTVTISACTKFCTRIATGGSSTATFSPKNGATAAGGIRDKAGNGVTGTATEVGVHF